MKNQIPERLEDNKEDVELEEDDMEDRMSLKLLSSMASEAKKDIFDTFPS